MSRNIFFSKFEYHMFYVLYSFVTYLLTLRRISNQSGDTTNRKFQSGKINAMYCVPVWHGVFSGLLVHPPSFLPSFCPSLVRCTINSETLSSSMSAASPWIVDGGSAHRRSCLHNTETADIPAQLSLDQNSSLQSQCSNTQADICFSL
jgi:hypothetical protein